MRFLLFFAVSGLFIAVFSTDVRGAEQVRITKVTRSPEFRSPRVRVVYPKHGKSVFSRSPKIKLEVAGYKLGVQTRTGRKTLVANSDRGQHIHLIVDNKPYKAIYDVSKPVRLDGLSPGTHTLVVFPSRSYHESVKTEGASDIVNFSVFSSFGKPYPLENLSTGPALIYSRPKGSYKGKDAERIMVDFYIHNAVLRKDGYRVRLTVHEGEGASRDSIVASEVFAKWSPAFVEGLKSGVYTFRIELLDSSGDVVPGRFGSESRVIEVVR